MKVRKGEVKLNISPNDWVVYRKAGWRRVQEPSPEQVKEYHRRQREKGKE